jgi:hypothetical protein
MALPRWLSALAGRPPGPDARTRSEVLVALGGAGCAVCRTAQEAVRRWFFAYENDTRVDLRLRERLGRSGGFCTAHTRQLLDSGASTSWLARWVFADVASAAVRRLAGERTTEAASCPACEAAHRASFDALTTLAVGLGDPEAQQLLDAGDGLCVTHGLAVINRAGTGVGRVVATMLESRLGKDPVTARDHLVGADPDIARRRRMRERHSTAVLSAEETARSSGPLGDVELVLDWPCCPVCAETDRLEWRYLAWAAGSRAPDDSEAPADTTMCARHLGDLSQQRHAGDGTGVELTGDGLLVPVAAVIDHVAGQWRRGFQGYLQRLDAGAWSSQRAARGIGDGVTCQLCVRRSAAVTRQLRLLDLVAAHPDYGNRLAAAHGVCLRHGLTMDLAAPWQRLLRARIGLLSYELDEAERKSRWDARWEVRGAEMAVWQRAPTLLDGGVLGPVPPAEPTGPEP